MNSKMQGERASAAISATSSSVPPAHPSSAPEMVAPVFWHAHARTRALVRPAQFGEAVRPKGSRQRPRPAMCCLRCALGAVDARKRDSRR